MAPLRSKDIQRFLCPKSQQRYCWFDWKTSPTEVQLNDVKCRHEYFTRTWFRDNHNLHAPCLSSEWLSACHSTVVRCGSLPSLAALNTQALKLGTHWDIPWSVTKSYSILPHLYSMVNTGSPGSVLYHYDHDSLLYFTVITYHIFSYMFIIP